MPTPEPVITSCAIGPYPRKLGDPLPVVRVTFADGTRKDLFRFYPDEVTFTEAEFVGLTERQARALYYRKDRDHLRS